MTTAKLKIPLIDGAKPLLTRQFNAALQAVDKNALPIKHAENRAHFELWQEKKAYKKKDIVRTVTCPSWGFWLCAKEGTSANIEPVGYGEGDTFADGTVSWVLKRFGTGESDSSSTEHAVTLNGSDINVVYRAARDAPAVEIEENFLVWKLKKRKRNKQAFIL